MHAAWRCTVFVCAGAGWEVGGREGSGGRHSAGYPGVWAAYYNHLHLESELSI